MHDRLSQQSAPAGDPPPRRRGRRWLKRGASLVVLYALWCGVLFLVQDRLLFRQDLVSELSAAQADFLRGGQRMDLTIAGTGPVTAHLFPAADAGAGRPAPLVVFMHGNAELAGHQSWLVENYRRLGCAVLLPEYRGYGASAGRPSEAAIVGDVVAFLDQALKRPDVDPLRIILHGRSLGGGVAAQVAAQRKPAGLILESTFASVAVMSRQYLAPQWLVRHPFRTDRVLPALDAPVLIFHGTNDRVVPVEHARINARLAARATRVEYACDHNDFPGPGNAPHYWEAIHSFLREHGILRP